MTYMTLGFVTIMHSMNRPLVAASHASKSTHPSVGRVARARDRFVRILADQWTYEISAAVCLHQNRPIESAFWYTTYRRPSSSPSQTTFRVDVELSIAVLCTASGPQFYMPLTVGSKLS